MDKTAVYVALTTLALAAILAAFIIVPRRLIRRVRKKPMEPSLGAREVAFNLTFFGILVLLLFVEPWLGIVLFIASIVYAFVQIWRLPRPQRSAVFAHVTGAYRTPFSRVIDYIMMLTVLVVFILAVWDFFR